MLNSKLVLITLLTAGCAMQPSQSNVERLAMQSRIKDTIPTCSNDKECQIKWDAAQAWVATNLAYKIQIASSSIIETFNSTTGSRDISARVVKEPIGDSKYRMVITLGCGSWLGCNVDIYEKMLQFNNYVNNVK